MKRIPALFHYFMVEFYRFIVECYHSVASHNQRLYRRGRRGRRGSKSKCMCIWSGTVSVP